jgi:hypothetical protein
LKSRRLVDEVRIKTFEIEIPFGPSYKEGHRLMDFVKASKIDIATIYEINGLNDQTSETSSDHSAD